MPSGDRRGAAVGAQRRLDRFLAPLPVNPHERPHGRCAQPAYRRVCLAATRRSWRHRSASSSRGRRPSRIAEHLKPDRIESDGAQCVGRRVNQVPGLPVPADGSTYSAWLPPRTSVFSLPVLRSRTATSASSDRTAAAIVNSRPRPPGRSDGKQWSLPALRDVGRRQGHRLAALRRHAP